MTQTIAKQIKISGTVAFASRKPKTRAVIQPATGKRVICNFAEPQLLHNGQVVTLIGALSSEGWESVVLTDAELVSK